MRTTWRLFSRTVAGGVTVIVLAAGSAGCTGDTKAPDTKAATVAERLAAAKATTDAASSLHLRLTSKDIPKDAGGVIAADGTGTHAPAFKGTLDARIGGVQVKVDAVAVDGTLYLKLPFTPLFVPTDPATYSAPDPATLFSTTSGVSSFLPATKDPKLGQKTRRGSEVLQTITGTLPGSTVVDLLKSGERTGTFSVTYGITDPGNQLRTATLTGPFFTGATSTYTVTLDRYGEPVEITKP